MSSRPNKAELVPAKPFQPGLNVIKLLQPKITNVIMFVPGKPLA